MFRPALIAEPEKLTRTSVTGLCLRAYGNDFIEFDVVSDSINHAWLKAVNYVKSLGLDADLVEYFSVELL